MTRRERRLGIGMAAVVVVWAAYAFAIEPMRDRIHTLQRIIPEKQAELQDVQAKCDRYVSLQRQVENAQAHMANRDADFQPLPFLESLIERHQLSSHLDTMEPGTPFSQPGYSETVVDINLKGISLAQLVRFLDAVETSGVLVHIGSLHIIKDATNEALLNSEIQIRSPRLSQDAVAADLPRP